MKEFERKGRRKNLTKQEAERRMEAGEEHGFIYIIEDSAHQAVKIGWARDPVRRLKSLQCGHPGELKLLAAIPGSRTTEHRIHCRLRDHRRFGEWFNAEAM